MKISIENLSKVVNQNELVFKNLTFTFEKNKKYALVGPNGSGKSTLLKILSHNIKPTNGRVNFEIEGKIIPDNQSFQYYGFIAPYLTIYEELLPLEHIKIVAKIRKIPYSKEIAMELLQEFQLEKHYLKPIKFFSSGMKQRMKFLLALLHKPSILFLDEPFSNLDEIGIKIFEKNIYNYTKNGILIIASNDNREISLTDFSLNIQNYK